MTEELRDRITRLIKREVLPAVGCTEPAAVALATAQATEVLGCVPDRIEVYLSGNVLKNAMGVGIPGTGMIGLPVAIALGALTGKAEYGLEVLKDVDGEAVDKAKVYIDEKRIEIHHKPDTPSNLYIDVKVYGPGSAAARVVISHSHTNFVFIGRNGDVLLDSTTAAQESESADEDSLHLTLADVWAYATESPIEEIAFINEARRLNKNAAKTALGCEGKGHRVGNVIRDSQIGGMGDSALVSMLSATAAACDARMAGEPVAVMSNSGSGNQGIAITMPIVAYAESNSIDNGRMLRALAMAHLASIYIKRSLGRLSALCGCVVASTGASMALVYLMGGDYVKATYAVKNMIATLTGMICDGAKPACSLKITSGVGTAYISALMAINNQCVTSTEGIIDDDVDKTIENFSAIGRDAMKETDRKVLEIMSKV